MFAATHNTAPEHGSSRVQTLFRLSSPNRVVVHRFSSLPRRRFRDFSVEMLQHARALVKSFRPGEQLMKTEFLRCRTSATSHWSLVRRHTCNVVGCLQKGDEDLAVLAPTPTTAPPGMCVYPRKQSTSLLSHIVLGLAAFLL